MNEPSLKLIAKDDADLQVIAAVIQDAIAPVSEMQFLPTEKMFILIVHRFCWDLITGRVEKEDQAIFERVCCALEFQGIETPQYIGFDPQRVETMLELLTIIREEGMIRLVFAGGAQIRFLAMDFVLRLQDFGSSWPTTHCPHHVT